MSLPGPVLPTSAAPQLDSYLEYCGRDGNAVGRSAPDPEQKFCSG